jgi:hypothetical protein
MLAKVKGKSTLLTAQKIFNQDLCHVSKRRVDSLSCHFRRRVQQNVLHIQIIIEKVNLTPALFDITV